MARSSVFDAIELEAQVSRSSQNTAEGESVAAAAKTTVISVSEMNANVTAMMAQKDLGPAIRDEVAATMTIRKEKIALKGAKKAKTD